MTLRYEAIQNIAGPLSFPEFVLSWTMQADISTGINLQVSSIPSNVTNLYVWAGSSVTVIPVSSGQTSVSQTIGLAAGTYDVRVVGTAQGYAVAGAYAAGVQVSGLTPLTLSLSPESVTLDSSTPSTVTAGSTFTATVDITDPAHWMDGIVGFITIDSGLFWSTTCASTAPGLYQCASSSLQAPTTAGSMSLQFTAYQPAAGPISTPRLGLNWTMQAH